MTEPQSKAAVDSILTADFVITMNADYDVFCPGAVAVKDDAIVAVGRQAEIVAGYAATERLDCGNAVIMPGLVNAHGHAPMTLVRALVDDLRLDVWLMGYMMPVEAAFVTPRFSWLGTQLASAEMIRSGTTTFTDMYYYEEAVADAAVQAGLRAVCTQSVLKFPTPDAGSYEESLARARDYVIRWQGHPLDRARRGTPRALHRDAGAIGRSDRAGAGVRRAAADPHRGDGTGSGRPSQGAQYAPGALAQEAGHL